MPEIPAELPFFFERREYARMIGILRSHRRMLIHGELTKKSISMASIELVHLDLEEIAPILIILHSPGGSAGPSLQLQDVVNALNSPVDILAVGDCASMAVDIMMMCRKRYMLPSSRLLVHYIRAGQQWIVDNPDRLEADMKCFLADGRATHERRLKLYQERTGLSRDELEEMFRYGEVHGAYFSAQKAVELKLADEILTDFKLFPQPKKKEE